MDVVVAALVTRAKNGEEKAIHALARLLDQSFWPRRQRARRRSPPDHAEAVGGVDRSRTGQLQAGAPRPAGAGGRRAAGRRGTAAILAILRQADTRLHHRFPRSAASVEGPHRPGSGQGIGDRTAAGTVGDKPQRLLLDRISHPEAVKVTTVVGTQKVFPSTRLDVRSSASYSDSARA
jgi:hypothetical protein